MFYVINKAGRIQNSGYNSRAAAEAAIANFPIPSNWQIREFNGRFPNHPNAVTDQAPPQAYTYPARTRTPQPNLEWQERDSARKVLADLGAMGDDEFVTVAMLKRVLRH